MSEAGKASMSVFEVIEQQKEAESVTDKWCCVMLAVI